MDRNALRGILLGEGGQRRSRTKRIHLVVDGKQVRLRRDPVEVPTGVIGDDGKPVTTTVDPDAGLQAITVDVRQPTCDEVDTIRKVGGEGSVRGIVEAALLCAVVPDTFQPLFEEADRKKLRSEPFSADSFIVAIGTAAIELIAPTADLGKGSGPTPNSGPASP